MRQSCTRNLSRRRCGLQPPDTTLQRAGSMRTRRRRRKGSRTPGRRLAAVNGAEGPAWSGGGRPEPFAATAGTWSRQSIRAAAAQARRAVEPPSEMMIVVPAALVHVPATPGALHGGGRHGAPASGTEDREHVGQILASRRSGLPAARLSRRAPGDARPGRRAAERWHPACWPRG